MRRHTAFLGASRRNVASLLLASIAVFVFVSDGDIATYANAASAFALNNDDNFRIKRAIVECLFYISIKDPQGYADLANPSPRLTRDNIRDRNKISLEFNDCVAKRGIPMIFW
jgi:hypothetical protein